MARKSPKSLVPRTFGELFDPPRRFRKDAAMLARKIPGIDPEIIAVAMAIGAEEYTKSLEFHWEGSERKVFKKVAEVGSIAETLLNAIYNLGPRARKVVLGEEMSFFSFIKTERGKWLGDLMQHGKEALFELEDTPFPGRPMDTTVSQQLARLQLLNTFGNFLMFHRNNIDTEYARTLIPELARAVHRIVCDPNLPKDSQLFRKEWEGRKRSKIG